MARMSVSMGRSLGATDKEARATSKTIAVEKVRPAARLEMAMVDPKALARSLRAVVIRAVALLERSPLRVA